MPGAQDSEAPTAIAAFLRACSPSGSNGDRVTFADIEAVKQLSGRVFGRVYGGLTMVSALIAAGHAAPGLAPYSLHTTFLRAGDVTVPIVCEVERLRDGRAVTTRRVRVRQGERVLAEVMVSFAGPRPGPAYRLPMPEVPDPEHAAVGSETNMTSRRLSESRLVYRSRAEDGELPSLSFWIRPVAPLPDDPLLQAAYLLYESDYPAVLMGHQAAWTDGGASLDHQIWWHTLPSPADWMLYTRESPVAGDGRALLLGAMYTCDGVRRVSTTQEFFFPVTRHDDAPWSRG